MSQLAISELPLPERREAAIREAVRVTGKRLRVGALDRECATAWRSFAPTRCAWRGDCPTEVCYER